MEKIFMMKKINEEYTKKINEEDTKKINEEDEQRRGYTCTSNTHAMHCTA